MTSRSPFAGERRSDMTLETLSTARCFGGTQDVYRHASRETGTDMTFAVYRAAAGRGGAPLPGRLVSVRPHLHPRQRHRERRVSARLRRARPDLRRARHQPARAPTCPTTPPMISARAPASTSTRPRRPSTRNYRMYSYVTEELPDAGRRPFPGRHGPPGDHRPFDGRPRRAHPRACAIPAATAASPPSRRSSRRAQVPWGEKALGRYLGAGPRRLARATTPSR